ncbi:MAG: lamin tail domain-containing protein, partial [Verrucomicrobia bacterium]|nr:lamin tail domain-containing protein [Verrucomicrobiota bacterium]
MTVGFAEPLITEFIADNGSGLEDEDGEFSDWIEIYNPDNSPASLAGYSLTDDATNLNKWTFPEVTLEPDSFLIVFASGNNRMDPSANLHTNFQLSDGGGGWMGFDYIQLNPVAKPIPEPKLPWAVGLNDDAWPSGNGGAANASFIQENGEINPLPGVPNSPEIDQEGDNDYYFAGVYSTVIDGNGDYEPVGEVREHEEAAERAFAGADNDLRYHFNLPASVQSTDELTVSFDALNLQGDAEEPRYGVEVYVNNVQVQSEIVIGVDELNTTYNTAPFTVAQV